MPERPPLSDRLCADVPVAEIGCGLPAVPDLVLVRKTFGAPEKRFMSLEAIERILAETSTYFSGAHVNAGVAVGQMRKRVRELAAAFDETLAPRSCGRLLVGQGDDTYDPGCVLPAGHEGVCKPEEGTDA